MLDQPTPEEQAAIAETIRRRRSRMTTRERVTEAVLSVGFAGAVAALWLTHPPHSFAVLPVLVCFVTLIVAARIQIDTPFGFTSPEQLAFVPLLFALPLPLVPCAVVVASIVARLPDVVSGEMNPSLLVKSIGGSWYVIGPVAVFRIANVHPDQAAPALLAAALIAQFASDCMARAVKAAITKRVSLLPQLRETWVWVVGAAP